METVLIDPAKVVIKVNGEILNYPDLCKCGKESDFGCHGIRNDIVYSEYLCRSCYNRSKK